MFERLPDGTSYESPEGDVLPLADIEEPAGFAGATTEFDGAPETVHSEEYRRVCDLIDAGIEKSRTYNHYKVEYEGKWIPLGVFLATKLFRLDLSEKERTEIVEKYAALDEAHETARRAARTYGVPEVEANPYAEYDEIFDEMDKKHASPEAARAAAYEAARRRGVRIPPELQL